MLRPSNCLSMYCAYYVKRISMRPVPHTEACPYCIDAYTSTCLEKGADEEQMMEALREGYPIGETFSKFRLY